MKNAKIVIDDYSISLYTSHLKRGNYRVGEVMQILLLRSDFNDFILRLELSGLTQVVPSSENEDSWIHNGIITHKRVDGYLAIILQTDFFKNRTEIWLMNFTSIAKRILIESYARGSAMKLSHNAEEKIVISSDDINYPNILYSLIEIDDGFRKILDTNKFEQEPDMMPIFIENGRFFEISINAQVTKPELISFIEKNWSEIERDVRGRNPSEKKERASSSSNFLRDIKILNKYNDFKNEGFKNPDVKVFSWLLKEDQIEIEPNTVRKIVSNLNKSIRMLNSDSLKDKI